MFGGFSMIQIRPQSEVKALTVLPRFLSPTKPWGLLFCSKRKRGDSSSLVYLLGKDTFNRYRYKILNSMNNSLQKHLTYYSIIGNTVLKERCENAGKWGWCIKMFQLAPHRPHMCLPMGVSNWAKISQKVFFFGFPRWFAHDWARVGYEWTHSTWADTWAKRSWAKLGP